jgi:hypothetical protein
MPAIVAALLEGKRKLSREKVRQGLLAGTAIGYLCKHNATLSGHGDERSRFGCQPRPLQRSIHREERRTRSSRK